MKFCPHLISAMNFEYSGIIPCCTAFAHKVPLFPYGETGAIARDAYKAFIREALADINSGEASLVRQAAALSGKKAYFWGYDAPYARYRHIFSETAPQAILVNKDHDPSPPARVDGIPVRFAQDVLREEPVLPIIIFARDAYMKWVVFMIEEMNPAFGGANLTLCRFFEE